MTNGTYIYDNYYRVRDDLGKSYYDVYFNENPEKRILPMEYRLMQHTVDDLLSDPAFRASRNNQVNIVDFGAGNGRSLPFYLQLAQKLTDPSYTKARGYSHPFELNLKLSDVAWPGLVACENILLSAGFEKIADAGKTPSAQGYLGSVFQKENMRVQSVYTHISDTFERTGQLIGKPHIVHSMFGVFSSICDNFAVIGNASMLAANCLGNGLVVVGAEGRFPDVLKEYNEMRHAKTAPPEFQEDGVISFSYRYETSDGGEYEVGRERSKLYSFQRIGDLMQSSGWDVIAPVVVDMQSPVVLSRNWDAAQEDEKKCVAINKALAEKRDPVAKEKALDEFSRTAFHIGLVLKPSERRTNGVETMPSVRYIDPQPI